MPNLPVTRLMILSVAVAAAIAVGASPAISDATELAASPNDIPAGRYEGKIAAADNAVCRTRERLIRATVAGGRASFVIPARDDPIVMKGDIDADGKVRVSGTMPKGQDISISGQFSGGSFSGTYIVGGGKCYGTVTATTAKEAPAAVANQREARRTPEAATAAVEEARYWQDIQHSANLSDFMTYLERYPNGIFVPLAESQMRALIARQGMPAGAEPKDDLAGIKFGRYHALVIGINDYAHLPKLKTAVSDAKAVAALLENDYGFKVRLLIDPGRTGIIDVFDEYLRTLTADDNLLIYYAGHGWLDKATDRGYWLPADAQEGRRSNWVSNSTITDTLKSLAAKHVMVVADSCFSGTLTRAAVVGLRDKNYLRRMAEKQARVAMVSGGVEPVTDDAGSGNSPFAKAFMAGLRANRAVIDGTQLFTEVRRPVMLSAKQTPEYSDVRDAGHDGGDFLFVRKR